MKTDQIVQDPRKFVLILETGEEITKCLKQFANDHQILSATIEAIGALERCSLGYFDWNIKDYRKNFINEQVEVLSLLGNFSLKEGKPMLHAHLVIAKSDATAYGGHLLEAIVRPTLEVIVTESPEHLIRRWDEASHLALIDV